MKFFENLLKILLKKKKKSYYELMFASHSYIQLYCKHLDEGNIHNFYKNILGGLKNLICFAYNTIVYYFFNRYKMRLSLNWSH